MTACLSSASLLLYPQSPQWCPHNRADLASHLAAMGFIGEAIAAGNQAGTNPGIDSKSYFAGEQFLDHVAFMGCAPNIRFTPDSDSEKFTHVRLQQHAGITALAGEHSRAPNCPQCKKAFTAWNTQLESLTKESRWCCEHCQQNAAPWDYQWRRSAGFARVFIEVTDIYPKEALPQQALLEQLEHISGIRWDYFYLF